MPKWNGIECAYVVTCKMGVEVWWFFLLHVQFCYHISHSRPTERPHYPSYLWNSFRKGKWKKANEQQVSRKWRTEESSVRQWLYSDCILVFIENLILLSPLQKSSGQYQLQFQMLLLVEKLQALPRNLEETEACKKIPCIQLCHHGWLWRNWGISQLQ